MVVKNNLIKDKTFEFSLKIIELYKYLVSKNEYVISKQLLKSSTSIGANIVESIHGQSKKDFLSKMYISYKEANETLYWLELIIKGNLIDKNLEKYVKDINEIIKIISSIIITTKDNLK